MEEHIRILDCTLRDGGHLNQGKFGEKAIKSIIERLIDAKIDIIEVGFLWDQVCGKDTARYITIEDVKKILPSNKGISKISLMADFIDLSNLESYDGTVEYIRLSFKRNRLDWGLKTAQILMQKGYKCFINPVNCNVYSDQEYLKILDEVNKIKPYGFSIVDTFGVMRIEDLSHRYYLVEHNLDPDIVIGLHLHENLGLAYSLAQHYIQIANPKRKIIIDGSLLGMGRVPGNLCIEQIIDYLNIQFGKKYITEPVLDAIDDFIAPLKKEFLWGYAIPYALSAKYNLHRTYAEYLMKKNRLKTKDIQRILSKISPNKAENFNQEYVEMLYLDYMNVEYKDTEDLFRLSKELNAEKEIFVLAPGSSIKTNKERIRECLGNNSCVIAVNFVPDFMETNFIFLTNMKRHDEVNERNRNTKLVVTSNLLHHNIVGEYTISYNNLVYFGEQYCDDSIVMLINLLEKIGITKIKVAGFDGRKDGILKYYDNRNNMEVDMEANERIIKILNTFFVNIEIEFLTDSAYKGYNKEG